MDLVSNILFIIFLACLGLGLWIFSKLLLRELDRQENEAIKRFQMFQEKLTGIKSDYRFYTTGHPYTWSETSEKEIYESFKNLKYSRHARPNDYLLNSNEQEKAIYIVYTRAKSFDWSSLLHYDEWLKNKEATRGAIAKYKSHT